MEVKPVVHTLTLNPRNGNYNWHFGLGVGTRIDVDPTGRLPIGADRTKGIVYDAARVEKLKPISGPASFIKAKLAERIGDDLATEVTAMMAAAMVALIEAQKKAKEKRAAKPRKVKAATSKPVDPGRAEVDARRAAQAAKALAERIEAEKRRVA
jgi:hypothetical protein